MLDRAVQYIAGTLLPRSSSRLPRSRLNKPLPLLPPRPTPSRQLVTTLSFEELACTVTARTERVIDYPGHRDHLLLLPLPADELHTNRKSMHLLGVVDGSGSVVNLLFNEKRSWLAVSSAPFGSDGVSGGVHASDRENDGGRVNRVENERACSKVALSVRESREDSSERELGR